MASIKKKIEAEHDRQLTNRQMTFAQKIVEGIYSNAECARLAGFKPELAVEHASRLLNDETIPTLWSTSKNSDKNVNVGMVCQLSDSWNACTNYLLVQKKQGSFLPLSMRRKYGQLWVVDHR